VLIFGCGSSREHAVWVFEVNDINVVVAESFTRIFQQNMFNCGILAVELDKPQLDTLFEMQGNITIAIDLENGQFTASSDVPEQKKVICCFVLNSFDKELVAAGGWLTYADQNFKKNKKNLPLQLYSNGRFFIGAALTSDYKPDA
jgi:3-isopropylmalate/(R)-2-methylmalate dehydratase small subunit